MNAENTSRLSEELKPLNVQIGQVREKIETLGEDLRVAEAELETFSADHQRFDALREICNALDRLSELDADVLFWGELPGGEGGAGHLERLRGRIISFEGETRAIEEKQEAVKAQINMGLDELDTLNEEVRDAYAREERRLEEFVLEREMSAVPHRMMVMPWTNDGESDRQFRRSLLIALLFSIVFGSLIPLVAVPVPDRADIVVEIPERLAMLVKKEPPKPDPVPLPDRPQEEPKPESDEQKPDKAKKKNEAKKRTQVAASGPATKAARKKAVSTGVLAFQHTFKDLMKETAVAKLGTEARISSKAPVAAGQARPSRSLVAMQATGSSGGIGGAAVSRNVGVGGGGSSTGDRIGDVGFARVESAVAGLVEEEGGR